MNPIVGSQNVRAAGYNTTTSTLTVEFKNGRRYEYYNVPVGLYHELTDGRPHPWTRTNHRIRRHRYSPIR
ncbi:KTSC domain-containing protein [Rhodococcus hoagii]|nr:KTSC domain-containing protein [Prescottella equi]NKS74708.1 KTSC domain-containing protein [Prescottella equi]NKZ88795.1 KTSC domain-containing protein [Prescottella equi]